MKFIYTAWFRSPQLSADDQDSEWPACFIVEAATAGDASAWGDRLASEYSVARGEQMLSSSVEPFETAEVPGKQELPVVPYGHQARADEIGW